MKCKNLATLYFHLICFCCYYFHVIQSLSRVRLLATPWTAAHQASLSFTLSQSLLKLVSVESVMPSNHLILSSPSSPAFNLSQYQGVSFSNESVLHIRWPKYWSFSFNISPSKEYPGLISFRIDWFDLLAVQGTLKCLLQHHSSKASILRHSAFFMVQLSYPHMATGKTIALTIWTFAHTESCCCSGPQSRLTLGYLHGLQHTRLLGLSPSPRVCPNSCPLSQWCYPTISSSVIPFSSCLQTFQHQGLFQWGHQVAKVWSFSFSISPSNGYSGLISFRIDLFDLLAVQRTLKSLLQHHSSKASVLQHSAFFMVQLSYPYMTTGYHSLDCTDLCQQGDVSAF